MRLITYLSLRVASSWVEFSPIPAMCRHDLVFMHIPKFALGGGGDIGFDFSQHFNGRPSLSVNPLDLALSPHSSYIGV
jgi:hypothetical protein